MFNYLDVTDSDTNKEENININTYWKSFFQNAKNKYLDMWKSLNNI